MQNISDSSISFDEYKSKYEENKPNFPKNPLEIRENINQNFSITSSLITNTTFSEEISIIPLKEFISKNPQITVLSDLQSLYKNGLLLRISCKSMIILFISLVYFKEILENSFDKALEDLIKRLEFFKYQVCRQKQLKLIEIFKLLKPKTDTNSTINPSINAFHLFIHYILNEKVFREGIIDLMQEIIVDLILNSNFHHIIQNRKIELKRFILSLRNSKNEEEMLNDELKMLISKCFAINFNISYLNMKNGEIYKEKFMGDLSEKLNNSKENDVFSQGFLDFLVINKGNNDNLSYIVLKEQDYESFFFTKLPIFQINKTNSHENQMNLRRNKENCDKKSSSISQIYNEKSSKMSQIFNNDLINQKLFQRKLSIETMVSGFTIRKIQGLLGNLEENSKNLDKIAYLC